MDATWALSEDEEPTPVYKEDEDMFAEDEEPKPVDDTRRGTKTRRVTTSLRTTRRVTTTTRGMRCHIMTRFIITITTTMTTL